jgi:hypothetical protein
VDKRFPMHVDGEPWEQPACSMHIKLRNKALMLRRTADARGMSILKMVGTGEATRALTVCSSLLSGQVREDAASVYWYTTSQQCQQPGRRRRQVLFTSGPVKRRTRWSGRGATT